MSRGRTPGIQAAKNPGVGSQQSLFYPIRPLAQGWGRPPVRGGTWQGVGKEHRHPASPRWTW